MHSNQLIKLVPMVPLRNTDGRGYLVERLETLTIFKWQRGLGRSESTPNFDPETEDETDLRMSLDFNLRKKANQQNFQRHHSKSMRNVSTRATAVPTTVLETTVKLRPGIDRGR